MGCDEIAPTAVRVFGLEVATNELAGLACEDCVHAGVEGEAQAGDQLCDEQIRTLIPAIAEFTGEMPWGTWRNCFFDGRCPDGKALALLKIGHSLPPDILIDIAYDGWVNVLNVAGYVDAVLPSSRGFRSVANDGHACFSHGERLIDDWLHANDIDHTREPRYPETRFRGDFLVNGKVVEYFGLFGDTDYEKRMALKAAAAAAANIDVIAIYPADVADWKSSQKRIAAELGISVTTSHAIPRSRPVSIAVVPVRPRPPRTDWVVPPTYEVERGYYPDPYGGGAFRFNDGTAWTYLVVDGRGHLQSHTPGVPPDVRSRIDARYKVRAHSEVRGGSAARRWTEQLESRFVHGDLVVPRLPAITGDLIFELAAWMDIAENFWTDDPEGPYRVAASYFSQHRLRQAEAAVLERFELRHYRTLDYVTHSISALRKRGHRPNPLVARFQLRGDAPTDQPIQIPSTLSEASQDQRTAIISFFDQLGERDLKAVEEPGSSVALRNSGTVIYVHPYGTKLRRRDLADFEKSVVNCYSWPLDLVCFVSGEVTENAVDYCCGSNIALFAFDPPAKPRILNFDAELFVGNRTTDESLYTRC